MSKERCNIVWKSCNLMSIRRKHNLAVSMASSIKDSKMLQNKVHSGQLRQNYQSLNTQTITLGFTTYGQHFCPVDRVMQSSLWNQDPFFRAAPVLEPMTFWALSLKQPTKVLSLELSLKMLHLWSYKKRTIPSLGLSPLQDLPTVLQYHATNHNQPQGVKIILSMFSY